MGEFFSFIHWTNILIIPGLLIGFTIHELAHATAAYFMGDYAQVEHGKFTLNPFRHISYIGTLAFLLVGIGWPNPMEITGHKFKDRPLAVSFIALAGPLASFTFSLAVLLLTLVMIALLIYSSGISTDQALHFFFPVSSELPNTFNLQAFTLAFTSKLAIASFWMAVTSLLPFPRMDGFVAIAGLKRYFTQRQAGGHAPVQAQAVAPPVIRRNALINQYKRRNNVSDIHFKLGTEYHQQNKFDDAIARYRQALANDKNFGPAYVNLGLAYLAKAERRKAIHAFRGAVQFSDDQKSQQEAWYQLHQLSEVSPVSDHADQDMTELGSTPWTDTKPHPNWFSLGLSVTLFLVGWAALYGYLFSGLLRYLQG
jgi:Zn-dependent protease